MGVRGLTARAGDTVFTSILCWLRLFPGLSVCVCGRGGNVIPHTAVLSLPSLFAILSAELQLLALKLSFWGRGRDSRRFPRSSLQLGAAPLRLSQPRVY